MLCYTFRYKVGNGQQARSCPVIGGRIWSLVPVIQIKSVSLVEVIGQVLITIQSSHLVINNPGYVVPFKHYIDVHNIIVLAQLNR